MDRDSWLAAIERDGTAFGDVCEAAGFKAPVPPCPGWSVSDLAWHLTEAHHFWRTMVADLRSSSEGYEPPTRPAQEDLLAMYRAGLDGILQVLTEADPAAEMWTWSNDQSPLFVMRRLAQETAVHRCDAELSAGYTAAVEAELASDGIDEFLEHFIGDTIDGAQAVAGSVHIHCGDVAGEWTIRPAADGGSEVTREHAKGDCALRGAASDLLLTLWRRQPMASVDVVGDADVAARFVAQTKLD